MLATFCIWWAFPFQLSWHFFLALDLSSANDCLHLLWVSIHLQTLSDWEYPPVPLLEPKGKGWPVYKHFACMIESQIKAVGSSWHGDLQGDPQNMFHCRSQAPWSSLPSALLSNQVPRAALSVTCWHRTGRRTCRFASASLWVSSTLLFTLMLGTEQEEENLISLPPWQWLASFRPSSSPRENHPQAAWQWPQDVRKLPCKPSPITGDLAASTKGRVKFCSFVGSH